jgi:Cytochrome P460
MKSMQGSMLLASAVVVSLWPQVLRAQVTDSPPVTAEAVLQIPKINYRKEWVEIGSVSSLAEKSDEGSKQIDTVYVERKNLEAYLRDGKFPDGAVLVKELLGTKTEQLTTGKISYAAGEVKGRFVMVKDSKGKLGSGPRFGDGWAWAFYKGNETTQTVTGDFKVDCVGCHQAAKDDDMVHVRLYPLLQR